MKSGMDRLRQDRWYWVYRDRLDVRQVLEHYGAQNCTERPGDEGSTEILHSCLFDRVEPHHRNGDMHPSASVNVDTKKYFCYAGGWKGDLFHLIMKLEGRESFSDALLATSDLFAAEDDRETFQASLRKVLDSAREAYSVNLPSYSETILNGFRWPNPHPYLVERGITPEAVDLLKLGYDERENRVVFPHVFRGHLVGFQKRVVPPRPGQWPGTVPDYPKYRSSSGFPKAESLYGYDLARTSEGGSSFADFYRQSSVIVVESPMSVAKAYSLGIPGVVATFGAKVTNAQIRLLKDFYQITLWFDDDTAGRAGERQLVQALDTYPGVRVVSPDPGKDLADYDCREDVQKKLDAAVPALFKLAHYGTEKLRSLR
jgi:DNA primase